jgi:hypothetical protein
MDNVAAVSSRARFDLDHMIRGIVEKDTLLKGRVVVMGTSRYVPIVLENPYCDHWNEIVVELMANAAVAARTECVQVRLERNHAGEIELCVTNRSEIGSEVRSMREEIGALADRHRLVIEDGEMQVLPRSHPDHERPLTRDDVEYMTDIDILSVRGLSRGKERVQDQGTGQGLAQVRKRVAELGGDLQLATDAETTTLKIVLDDRFVCGRLEQFTGEAGIERGRAVNQEAGARWDEAQPEDGQSLSSDSLR